MSTKTPEPPAPSAPPPVATEGVAKIPSLPVLAVGTPSRPAPGTSAALAAGIPPAPRVPSPSQPLSTPPAPAVRSEPAPSRSESSPPGTSRKLAPPPKPRRDSMPAPGEGTPSVPPVELAPPVVVRSAPPPATASAELANVAPAIALPVAPVEPAPVATTAPNAEVAVQPAAAEAPQPPRPGSSEPGPAVRSSGAEAPSPPRPAVAEVAVPPRPSSSDAPAPRVVSPSGSPVPVAPTAATSAPPVAVTAGASPPPVAPTPSGSFPPVPRGSFPPVPGAAGASPLPVAPTRSSLPPGLTSDPGGHARVTPPQRLPLPLPRPSEPPPPAHVIVGGESHSQSKPTPAPAIDVMRIIAIGTPKAPGDIAGEEALEEPLSDVEHDEQTPIVARATALEPGEIDVTVTLDAEPHELDTHELDEAELAPDSGDDRPTLIKPGDEKPTERKPADVLELGREDALSVPPEEPTLADLTPPGGSPATDAAPRSEARAGDSPAAEALSGEVRPPPPPLRKPQPPRRGDSSRPRPRRALKRPWWEDLFGEDFSRAVPRLTDKQVAREVDFIEESLGVAKGGVVLDLACGAGHHAVNLAGRGYGVVGYDLSVYQLALAAEVAQEQSQKINFLHGDMREMAFEAMFDGIYCWNTSFGYFEEEKNAAVAERIFRALKPGGMFLVDIANRDFAAMYSPSQLWYEGDSCVCMDDMSVDFITSRLRVKRSVIFDDGRSRECAYSIRLYSLHELGKLLHDVGFRVTEASGHTSTPGVFFGELSPRLIVLAQKP